MLSRRLAVLAGVGGPVSFVGAWLVAGARTEGYSPVQEAISQLAREGAPTGPLMTAGLVGFGVLMPIFAVPLAKALHQPALRFSVSYAGLATLGVAALPLSREGEMTVDLLHGVAAGSGYLAMAVSPLLGGLALRGRSRPVALACYSVAIIAALALTASIPDSGYSGALQRLGLTLVDTWYVVLAGWLLRSESLG